MFDLVDAAEKNLQRQIEFVRASETRIRLILPLLFLTTSAWTFSFSRHDPGNYFQIFFLVLSSGALFFSAAQAYRAFFPNVMNAKSSLLFFGDIKNHTRDGYFLECQRLEQDRYLQELCDQAHRNSEIAALKFQRIQASLGWLAFGSIATLLTSILEIGRSLYAA